MESPATNRAFGQPTSAHQPVLATGDESPFASSPAPQQTGFRGPAVCKIVGITYRQLDYWARTDLVRPTIAEASGSGSQREYSFDDIVALRLIKRLLDAGVSLQKVRQALDEVRHTGQSLNDLTLVSDGTSVYAIDDDQQMIDLLQRGQGVFAIALKPVVDELRGEIRAFPTTSDQAPKKVEGVTPATPMRRDVV